MTKRPSFAPPEPVNALRNSIDENATVARSFFVPAKARLDIGSDMDPIDLGLVALNEAEMLFSLYVREKAQSHDLESS